MTIDMVLNLDETLRRAIEAHNSGQIKEADKLYTEILAANSEHANANHNKGIIALGIGSLEQALPFLKKAVEVNPNREQYWISYISALTDLGDVKTIGSALKKAKKKGVSKGILSKLRQKNIQGQRRSTNSTNQDPLAEQLQPLIDLYNKSQLSDCFESVKQLLDLFPNSAVLFNFQGAIHFGLGQVDNAIISYSQAIKLKPDYAETHFNMGNVLKSKGLVSEAIVAYRKAIKIKPSFAEAYGNMGNALQDKGEVDKAIVSYKQAIELKPDYTEAFSNMAIALRAISFTTPINGLNDILFELLSKNVTRPADIAPAIISLLRFEPAIKSAFEHQSSNKIKDFLPHIILALSKVPLLTRLMSICPLADLEFESLLSDIRSTALRDITNISETPEALTFYSAMALQCFTNEYIYTQTELETEALLELEKIVCKGFTTGQQPRPILVTCLASYKSLHEYSWCHLLDIPENLKELGQRQIWDIGEEARLALEMPLLHEVSNNISSKVRTQYEQNPYPRWVRLGLSQMPQSVSQVVSSLNLKVANLKSFENLSPNILIGGCGTGQHSISTSSRFRNSKILAVDLSMSSLSYAKRKTAELGISNIEYMQADILDLGLLDKQFDIVESNGVLHHMDDPMAGWGVLVDCLKYRGLMRIGLYSELARNHIVKIRHEISEAGIVLNDSSMKTIRAELIRSDKPHHKQILSSFDFYSLSGLRDAIFHEQEHRFSILQIGTSLDELGLTFCGFEDTQIVHQFKTAESNENALFDLAKWDSFEKENPTIFRGMYQFWCQKIK